MLVLKQRLASILSGPPGKIFFVHSGKLQNITNSFTFSSQKSHQLSKQHIRFVGYTLNPQRVVQSLNIVQGANRHAGVLFQIFKQVFIFYENMSKFERFFVSFKGIVEPWTWRFSIQNIIHTLRNGMNWNRLPHNVIVPNITFYWREQASHIGSGTHQRTIDISAYGIDSFIQFEFNHYVQCNGNTYFEYTPRLVNTIRSEAAIYIAHVNIYQVRIVVVCQSEKFAKPLFIITLRLIDGIPL